MVDPDLSTPSADDDGANAAQREYWTDGPGGRWVSRSDQYDAMLRPFLERVLEQAEIVPGEAALDVGCGPGPLTRAAALAGADVLGVDISTTMIDAATAIAAPGARFEVLDAQTAHLAPVDVVISRFGVMFFEDPVAAFANLATTGGRLCFVCWRSAADNAWIVEPSAAVMEVIGAIPTADPLAPGPFAFADRDRVAGILGEAGWSDIRIDPFDTSILIGGPGTVDDAAEFATHGGPAARLIAEESKEVQEMVRQAMLRRFAAHHDGEGVRLGASTWIATARTS